MARPRSRLDLLCVPDGVDHTLGLAAWEAALAAWEAAGLVAEGRPTARMVDGGGQGIVLDRPGARVAYGNQAGGTRVRCPVCGEGMARAFAGGLERARQGGDLRATCPSCGAVVPLHAVQARPPVRIARTAVILQDVDGPSLTVAGAAAVRALLGPFAVVLRRVS